jgi:hypothetical protein
MTSPERLWIWIAWKLPRPLVKWAVIRLFAHATTGRYGSTSPPELTAMDALKRWDDPVPDETPESDDRPPTIVIAN